MVSSEHTSLVNPLRVIPYRINDPQRILEKIKCNSQEGLLYIFSSLYHFITIEVQFLIKFVLVKSSDNSYWNISVLLRKIYDTHYNIDNLLERKIEKNNENISNKDKHKLKYLFYKE